MCSKDTGKWQEQFSFRHSQLLARYDRYIACLLYTSDAADVYSV